MLGGGGGSSSNRSSSSSSSSSDFSSKSSLSNRIISISIRSQAFNKVWHTGLLYKHIFAKRKQLGISLTKMYWLLGKSKLSTSSKFLIYKTVLKPIRTYGI
jgi:hypothetical protein